MTEKQPRETYPPRIDPLEKGKTFRGFAIHGVFMGLNSQTAEQEANLQDKIRSIRQHRN